MQSTIVAILGTGCCGPSFVVGFYPHLETETKSLELYSAAINVERNEILIEKFSLRDTG